MQARGHPSKGTGDRRPPRHLGALRAVGLVTGRVVPVDVGGDRSLFIEHPHRISLRRNGIDGPHAVAILVITLVPGVGVFHDDAETVVHDVLPRQLDAVEIALGSIGGSRDRPRKRHAGYGSGRPPGIFHGSQIDVRLGAGVDVVGDLLVERCRGQRGMRAEIPFNRKIRLSGLDRPKSRGAVVGQLRLSR